ncbi:MAG TPA: YaeQ family protein [Myxococcales bacterium]|nr:YaeQ family protein [Myxococcales bacterium]
MALPSTRREFRITLSHVPRAINRDDAVILAQHPSETEEHVVLRVLARCVLFEESLAFGPGLSTPDAADLWARDLTGRLTLWVECGTADAEDLVRVAQRNAGARVHAVFGDDRRLRELCDQLRAFPEPKKGESALAVWRVDPALVRALARSQARRQAWTVTVLDEHLYVEADGAPLDGPLARLDTAAARAGALPSSDM